MNSIERSSQVDLTVELRKESTRIFIASISFSLLLVLIRILYTGTFRFMYMPWNLILAIIPFGISSVLRSGFIKSKFLYSLVCLCWLLFIPNTFYIITDLFHLQPYPNEAPLYYDLILLVSFAWNGLLLGVLSVRQMEKIVALKIRVNTEYYFIYPLMALNAFGVYIGRFLRFNSWDFIANPFQLFSDMANIIIHPIEYRHAWAMVLFFSILMAVIYGTIKRISQFVK